MATNNRFVRTKAQKLLFWLPVSLIALQLLPWEPVLEALLAFVFAGVVPTTDTQLSPLTLLVGELVALTLLLVGIAGGIGSKLAQRAKDSHAVHRAIDPVIHLSMQRLPVTAVRTRTRSRLHPATVRARDVSRSSLHAGYVYGRAISNTAHRAQTGLRLWVVHAWQTVAPRLYRLDDWLEIHTKLLLHRSVRLVMRSEAVRVLLVGTARYHTLHEQRLEPALTHIKGTSDAYHKP